jgi:serine/threonine protein phosphatase PrpC
LLVADGVGGRSGGELAARIAVREIEQGIKQDLSIEAAFKRAHVLIKLERKSDPKLAGMSTTATLAMIKDDQATVYSVGDSLAFLSKNDPPGLIMLNKPQVCSLFGQQVSPPPYRTRDMVNLVLSLARQKSLLRNSLGAEFPLGEKPLIIRLCPQDKLILASDGLKLCWDDLVYICSKSEPINTIVVLLKEESLWQDSNNSKKSDNISIIGCEYRG